MTPQEALDQIKASRAQQDALMGQLAQAHQANDEEEHERLLGELQAVADQQETFLVEHVHNVFNAIDRNIQ